MELVTKILNRITKALAIVSIVFIFILAVMYGCDIIGRLVLKKQITGTFEIAQFMLCLITFLAFPYAQTSRSHIHVAFIINKFPKKMKYIVAAIGFLACCFLGVIMIYALIVQGNYAVGVKLSTVLKLPFAPMYYTAATLMGFFVITLFVDAVRCIAALFGCESAKAEIDKVYK